MKWGIGKTRSWDHPSHPLLSDSSLRPCLGQGASLGEEAVLADSGRAGEVVARGWAGEKSGLFEYPTKLWYPA